MKTEFYKEFKSGLRVIFKKMPYLYTVSFGVMVGTGSRFEKPEVNGYSHFIEHLLFKGTQTRTALDISEEIDAIGGQINAFTSKDMTCFYTRTAAEHLEKCFDIISDMLFRSKFDPKEIDMEKKVILEEISMDEDVPEDVCHELIAKSIFGTNALSHKIVGTAKNIKESTRESILEYKDNYYLPTNTVISIAGNAEFEDIIKLVEKYFESVYEKHPKKTIPTPEEPEYRSAFLHKFKDVEQSHISIAYACFPLGTEMSPAASIVANILGGGMSSRLFQSVREKNGMAYSVYAYNSLYADSGYLEIYCGTNPSNIKKLIPLLKKEIEMYREGYFTDKEFEIGKAQLIGNTIIAQESSMTVMNAYGSYLVKKNIIFSMEDRIKRIREITKEDVKKAIDLIFSHKPALAYVGQKTDDFELLKEIW
jgi:predicted Zn-dependent peptidase